MLNDLLAKNQTSDRLYVEDVFSTYLYSGTSASQTITNGIDVAGKGGLVWLKSRAGSVTPGYDKHILFDTARTNSVILSTNSTAANEGGWGDLYFRFKSNGFDTGTGTAGDQQYLNKSGVSYASWTFRKAPKFFDVVTWTGNGTVGRQISHSLGVAPGMIIVKRTDSTSAWLVYHRSIAATDFLELNSTAAAQTSSFWNNTSATSTYFTVNANSSINASGGTYVAYLFAHDTTADGIVQCGSFTTDGSGNATVSLGWEPQFGIFKNTGAASNWLMFDTMRGAPVDGNGNYLQPNTSNAEAAIGSGVGYLCPTATGFQVKGLGGVATIIYLAIRRGPMRTPTDATKVFQPVIWTGNSTARNITASGLTPDLTLIRDRSATTGYSFVVNDRLRGSSNVLRTWATDAETTGITTGITSFNMDGISLGTDSSNYGYNKASNPEIGEFFRRAPGFFDVVCYTGTGSARTVSHNLGVTPELMIVKSRSDGVRNWSVYSASLGTSFYLNLNDTTAQNSTTAIYWNNTAPTASVFSLGTGLAVNTSGATYVAYLFASCPGVSKVGSYTGTGTTLQINCGFTNGARFILIKRTDSTGDWYVYDSARGIIAGNDPYLLLNSTAAEVTNTDYVDPYSAGFELSSTAPAGLNANGGTYIYLAIA